MFFLVAPGDVKNHLSSRTKRKWWEKKNEEELSEEVWSERIRAFPRRKCIDMGGSSRTNVRCVLVRLLKNIGCMSVKGWHGR